MKFENGHDILEAEHSEEIDDDMNFNEQVPTVPKSFIEAKKGSSQHRGATMFVNGKPIVLDKKDQALNKREKSNWLVHILFIRQEYTQCMKFVDELLEESEKSEYALYLKALILRIKGNIHDSLDLFKKCHLLNPNNIEYLKQFGRSLYLLGRHKQAIELFDECLELDSKDWEIFFYKGLSYRYLRQFEDAIKNFK